MATFSHARPKAAIPTKLSIQYTAIKCQLNIRHEALSKYARLLAWESSFAIGVRVTIFNQSRERLRGNRISTRKVDLECE